MWRLLVILFFIFVQSIIFNNLALANNDSHYVIASEFVDITYNKEASYQNFIRFGVLPAKERYQNNPKTKEYSDILVNVVREVLDTYFNDSDIQNKLKEVLIRIYMDEFTKNEIKEMITFYKTATGRKVLKKLPVIMQKAWEEELELGSNLPPKYKQMLIGKLEELQKKGILPKEFN